MKILFSFIIFCSLHFAVSAKSFYTFYTTKTTNIKPILPGACQTAEYLPLLRNKRVAVFANQTSVIGKTNLIDTLTKSRIVITKVFAPEHGFRGTADAGEKVKSYTDPQTGILVVSLYGSKIKPAPEDLKDVDILLFDIQDVGVRFYTYISSLQYFIESAAENGLPLIILDRPNPNGFYVDGPVLDTAYKSFVGMQPVPVVYGMTMGEYAQMLVGEQWLNTKLQNVKNGFKLIVIKCKNYTHSSKYILPVKPSPNLADANAVYWYPSTCFFEGTVLSEGRGTDHPFMIFGHPALPDSLFDFTPHSTEGAGNPKFNNIKCYGWNVDSTHPENDDRLQLKWLLQAYNLFPDKEKFFLQPQKNDPSPQDYFFNKLAGSNELMQQIKEGLSEQQIRESWQPKLEIFKQIRKQYLLYTDF